MDAIRHDDALPEVSEETLGRIEARVFETIRDEKRTKRAGARRRRFLWQGVGIAAAIVAVAAVISPAVIEGISGEGGALSSADGGGGADSAPDPGAVPEAAPDAQAEDASGAESGADVPSTGEDGTLSSEQVAAPADQSAPEKATEAAAREIIRTGTASVLVDDATAAAQAVAQLATDHEGWVEQLSIGADQSFVSPDQTGGSSVWVPDDGGFVSIRVPAGDLDAVMDSLDSVGEVTSERIGSQDVTSTAVDLRARIDAARASVARLTDLLAQAGSVGDLVQVETTLSDRQAELESLEQQLASLEGQVAMSTLSVSLLTEAPPVKADPAGFGDGLAAGWDGLLATLNGIVIALGFLLPWLGVAAVIILLIWGIRRLTRRTRRGGGASASGSSQEV